MHLPGHNTVQVQNFLASVGISGQNESTEQNESRIKNNVPYLERQFVGGGQLEVCC